MRKKIAVIRSTSVRDCPFGLSVNISCKNVGDAIERMEPLDNIDKDSIERYRNSNRRIYRQHKTGERCMYADKIIDIGNAVHCDYGEPGEGIRDTPIKPSTTYITIFNSNLDGLYSYPMSNYRDINESHQYFGNIYASYLQTGEVLIQKVDAYNVEDDEDFINIVTNSVEFLD